MARNSGPAQDWSPARPMVIPENCTEPEAHAVKGSTKAALRNVGASRTRPRPLRTTLICVAGLLVLSAGILAAGPIAGHLPDLILGLCIVVLGIVCGAMLAVKA